MSGIDHLDLFVRSLDKLNGVTKDRHASLRAAITFVKANIKSEALSPQEKANLCFHPLKLACDCKEPALVSIAIGCLEKLLAHGFCNLEMIYQPPAVPEPKVKTGLFGGGVNKEAAAATAAAAAKPAPGVSPRNIAESSEFLVGQIVAVVCNVPTTTEELQLQTIRVLLTAVSTPTCALHGPYLLAAIRTIYNIFLTASTSGTNNPTQTTARASLSQIVGIILSRLEAEIAAAEDNVSASDPTSPTKSVAEPGSPAGAASPTHTRQASTLTLDDVESEDGGGPNTNKVFSTPSEKDCYLILNSLCSLSTKSDDVVAAWSIEMQSKILSLSLLQTCANPLPDVSRAAMRLFSHVVLHFRAHLKAEIGTFFYKVIFPLLETHSTSFAQKHIILRTLMGICEDSQVLTDLFVNYDCAIGSKPLYENLIYRVSKVVQTPWAAPNWVTPEEEHDLKLEGLRVISAITRGTTAWYEKRTKSTANIPTSAVAAIAGEGDAAAFVEKGDKEAFEALRKGKKEYERIVLAFNEKPKTGIKLAVETGLLKDDSPEEVAGFLETPGLNKLQIGEHLSVAGNKDVLICFIQRCDFAGLAIDDAMRLFLGKFKIKGEAQVVDRTMDCFTEIFCAHNPDAFSSAGTAFILSFAIMMLNTDAHNNNIKPENKMSLPSFLRTTAGIDDGKDLPKQYLEDIYRRITTNEIVLQGDANAGGAVQAKGGDKDDKHNDGMFIGQRKKKEMQQRIDSHTIAKASMDTSGDTWGQLGYIPAASSDVVVAMWEVSWIPTLAALSQPLEELDEQELIDLCLNGFSQAIRLCCLLMATTEREAFIASLAKFTHLSSLRSIDHKNVKSLMTLLTVANREAEGLESSWYEVLKCISLLDKLHLVSSSRDLTAGGGRDRALSQRSAELRKLEQENAEMVTQKVDLGAVEKLFANSGALSGSAVVFLVEALCRLSAEELGESSLRTYSLQKLVEVAEQNIGRMRFEWSQMWQHLSGHFISAGLSKNRKVAMFATDSLRQLAFKFLARDELGNFNFQRDILKPFDVIATQTRQTEIRELIAASIEQMVRARSKNIMSGWKVVLSALGRLAKDLHTNVVSLGFQVLEYLLLHCTHYFATRDLFVELVATVSRYADNVCCADVSAKCVSYLRAMTQFLITGMPSSNHALFVGTNARSGDKTPNRTPSRNSLDDPEAAAAVKKERTIEDILLQPGDPEAVFLQTNENTIDMHLWLSVLAGLSSLVNIAVEAVALEAIDALFDILTCHGDAFNEEQWHLAVGGTVHPIIENTLVNVSLMSANQDTSQDQSISRGAVVVKRTLGHYMQLLTRFPTTLAERVQVEAVTTILHSYHAQHTRLVTIGDQFLRMLLCPAPGKEILLKGLEDSQYKMLHTKLEHWVSSYHQQTEPGEGPRLQTLSAVAQVCTDLLGYGLQTKRMSNETALQYLNIISSILSFVQLRLDCSVTMSEGGASLEASEVTVLLAVEFDSFEALFRALAIVEDETLYATWISKALLRHKNALDHPRSTDAAQNESVVLAQVSGALLEVMMTMDDALFRSVCTVAYDDLCMAIRSCNPVICDPLSTVFMRYGRLQQGGAPILQQSPVKTFERPAAFRAAAEEVKKVNMAIVEEEPTVSKLDTPPVDQSNHTEGEDPAAAAVADEEPLVGSSTTQQQQEQPVVDFSGMDDASPSTGGRKGKKGGKKGKKGNRQQQQVEDDAEDEVTPAVSETHVDPEPTTVDDEDDAPMPDEDL